MKTAKWNGVHHAFLFIGRQSVVGNAPARQPLCKGPQAGVLKVEGQCALAVVGSWERERERERGNKRVGIEFKALCASDDNGV